VPTEVVNQLEICVHLHKSLLQIFSFEIGHVSKITEKNEAQDLLTSDNFRMTSVELLFTLYHFETLALGVNW